MIHKSTDPEIKLFMSEVSDIISLISEAEDTLENLRSLHQIANSLVLNQNSKRAIARQMQEAIVRHLDVICKMSADSFLVDKPSAVEIKSPTIESEDDEEPVPKKLITKPRNPKHPKI